MAAGSVVGAGAASARPFAGARLRRRRLLWRAGARGRRPLTRARSSGSTIAIAEQNTTARSGAVRATSPACAGRARCGARGGSGTRGRSLRDRAADLRADSRHGGGLGHQRILGCRRRMPAVTILRWVGRWSRVRQRGTGSGVSTRSPSPALGARAGASRSRGACRSSPRRPPAPPAPRSCVVRVADDAGGRLSAAAVATASAAVAAELEGSRCPLDDLPAERGIRSRPTSRAVRRAAERVRAPARRCCCQCHVDGARARVLELMRARRAVRRERAQLGAARRGAGRRSRSAPSADATPAARLDAAATPHTRRRGARRRRRRVTDGRAGRRASPRRRRGRAAGSSGSSRRRRQLELVASYGLGRGDASLVDAGERAAERALDGRVPVIVEEVEQSAAAPERASRRRCSSGSRRSAHCSSSSPPATRPARTTSATLATFGVRAAHALRASVALARRSTLELERTRALLAVVGQAISQLSLAHTLETAVARVGELLDVDRARGLPARREPPLRRGRRRPRGSARARWPSACSSWRSARSALAACSSFDDVAPTRASPAPATPRRRPGIEAAIAVPLLVARRGDRPARRLPADAGACRPRTSRRCSLRSPRSSPSPCRTRSCTSSREASRRRARARARGRAGGVEAACARSTRSPARSRRASRSRRLSTPSRAPSSTCSTSTPRSSACRTSAASCSSRARSHVADAAPRRCRPVDPVQAAAVRCASGAAAVPARRAVPGSTRATVAESAARRRRCSRFSSAAGPAPPFRSRRPPRCSRR